MSAGKPNMILLHIKINYKKSIYQKISLFHDYDGHYFCFFPQGDLDLFNENVFENLFNATQPDSTLEGQSLTSKKIFHSDHDYIAHTSPSEHSDSEVSVISDDSTSVLRCPNSEKNMTDDQLEMFSHPKYSSVSTDHHRVSSLPPYANSVSYDMLRTDVGRFGMIKAENSNCGTPVGGMVASYDYTKCGNNVRTDFGRCSFKCVVDFILSIS